MRFSTAHVRLFRYAQALMLFSLPAHGVLAAPPMQASLHVDATDLPRRLLHAQMDLPVKPGPMELNYVEWTPGNHSPSGPIQNVVDLTITDDHGRRLAWRRDPEKMTRLFVDVPDGVGVLTVSFAYITNQPSALSGSTDSYGFPVFGGLNWNTVLFYPGGVDKDEYMIDADIRTPGDWRLATALPAASVHPGRTLFQTASLAKLVDSPVIMGSTLRTEALQSGSAARHFLHAAAPSERQTKLGVERLQKIGVMIDQAEKVFGSFPRDEYHFLIMLEDALPSLGVEHNQSTYISLKEQTFFEAESKGDSIGVIPHEYIHAWCGKLRAPAGLLARDYHTTGDTRLLWVYEGLTTYYDDVLAVRSGLMSEDAYLDTITMRLAEYQLRAGRLWRSVEDTAVDLRHLRVRSESWADRRRGADYYAEGALFWMEADAIIRLGTQHERSLDDFTRSFFGVDAGLAGSPVTYTRQDIVEALAAVYDGEDWDALIRTRLESPAQSLSMAPLASKLGRQLTFGNEPTGERKKAENQERGVNLAYSLGFAVSNEGVITRIVPDSIADEAKLAYGMKVLAVDGAAFTPGALRRAVAESSESKFLTLLVEFGGAVSTKNMRYGAGLRSPRLAPISGAGDVLTAIMAPR